MPCMLPWLRGRLLLLKSVDGLVLVDEGEPRPTDYLVMYARRSDYIEIVDQYMTK
jgi:hypothetical protein